MGDAAAGRVGLSSTTAVPTLIRVLTRRHLTNLADHAQVPATGVVARAQARVRKEQMACTDRRVKLTSEVISGEHCRHLAGVRVRANCCDAACGWGNGLTAGVSRAVSRMGPHGRALRCP